MNKLFFQGENNTAIEGAVNLTVQVTLVGK